MKAKICERCLQTRGAIVFLDGGMILAPREELRFDYHTDGTVRLYKGISPNWVTVQLELSLCKNCNS